MADSSLISQVDDWLDDQALGNPDIVTLFEGLCLRLHALGIPIARANLMWSTLHPLFRSESVLWRRGQLAVPGQFVHQDTRTEQWLRSPMRHMLETQVRVLRRRLTGPRFQEPRADLPIPGVQLPPQRGHPGRVKGCQVTTVPSIIVATIL